MVESMVASKVFVMVATMVDLSAVMLVATKATCWVGSMVFVMVATMAAWWVSL